VVFAPPPLTTQHLCASDPALRVTDVSRKVGWRHKTVQLDPEVQARRLVEVLTLAEARDLSRHMAPTR
jgi:hypothetical protein